MYLLDHPGEGSMHKALSLFDPTQVAVTAWERDLIDIMATHECWTIAFTGFVEGETVEGEFDVCGASS
jgi:hypothetical protein